MSDTKALNGLSPSRKRGGASNSTATNEYPIASGFGTNIFSGDIVCNVAGNVVVLSVSTQKAIGVFRVVNILLTVKLSILTTGLVVHLLTMRLHSLLMTHKLPL